MAKPSSIRVPTDELIALLAKALTERFPHDPCAPGVHIAHLATESARSGVGVTASGQTVIYGPSKPAKKARWYVAAQRFTGSFGAGRMNVDREEHEDLDEAILALARRVAADIPVIRKQLDLARAVAQ